MSIDYISAKAALNQIASNVESQRTKLQRAKTFTDTAESALNALPTAYAAIVTYINDQATANPSEDLWQLLKDEKDEMVTAFQALKAVATSMKGDLASYDP